jgi:hypothetical protein
VLTPCAVHMPVLAARVAGLAATLLATTLALTLALAAPAWADQSLPCDQPVAGESLERWVNRCLGPIYGGDQGEEAPRCELHGTPVGSVPVQCVHPMWGWWSNSLQCYLRPADPQPPAGHHAWEGRDPTDGLVYLLACPGLDGVDGQHWWQRVTLRFFPSDSGMLSQLVAEAIGRLPISGPDIHLAPDPAGSGLVGLPVWMWTPVTEATWEPAPLHLPALGWVLVVQAHVDRIDWDMGDSVVPCRHPGTPYQPHFGADPSPTCGHVYLRPSSSQPDGRYQVTATTHWVVRWFFEGTAVGATLTTTRESSASLLVHELQVVTS